MSATPAPHATRRRYEAGCRCGDCTHANSAYQREYRVRTRPRADPVTTAGGYRYEQLRMN